MTRETEEFYWEQFYDNNLKKQIEEKGEAYIEWLTSKSSLVKQNNYLRNKYKLQIIWYEKYEGCYGLYFREPLIYKDNS